MDKLVSCQLGDLIEFQRGYDLPRSEFVEGEYPVQSSNGILGYHNEYKVEAPGITIGRSGTVGIPHLLRKNFFPHNTALFVKDFKGNDVEYIYYLLHYLDLGNQKSGSGVPTMNRNHLHPLKIKAYTDLETQQKIAQVLSTLDRKIALNQQINAELEKMAKTLYDYWFVQFDFPDENGNPYKSSGGEMVYHPELKREVPKGWVCGNIMEIANLLGGGTPSKNNDEFWNGNIPFFTPTDCNNDVYILSTKDNITAIGLEKSSTKLFPENTILLTARGSVGKLSLNAIPMAMNQSCYALMAKDEISYSFLYFLARQLIHILEIKATGSVFNSIVSNDIENTFLTIPEKIKIQEFGEICEPIFEKIKTNAKETQKLTQLRDFLLPMLMNGQVEVV
ncbi:restriction endonuclease subunit S [Actinobacillus equuli subsp. haemolyticus]|uniref:restriction endonuclease subunit S n=1 Tax=Actinobacillus equuli TaxID=718 RepID=UPI002442E035|nr:restriction endonuclease subunit S [Actinobacillus equuli]WGE63164.1 restriction endonuclease subunit S [Actinobacillus equuli subsp. haemolyticus]